MVKGNKFMSFKSLGSESIVARCPESSIAPIFTCLSKAIPCVFIIWFSVKFKSFKFPLI